MRRALLIGGALLVLGLAGGPAAAASDPAPPVAAASDPAPPVAAASTPALSVTTLPADHSTVTATDQVFVRFSEPVAPLSAGTLTIHEVVNDSVGPALTGASVQSTDDGSTWLLQLPSLLGRGAVYEVRIDGAQTVDASATLTDSWRFSTDDQGPPPKALTSLQTAAAAGAVALSWSAPVDFDRVSVVVLRAEGTQPPSPSDPATAIVGLYPDPVGAAVDATALAGHTYTYAAYAVDRLQRFSDVFVAPPVNVPNPQVDPGQPTQPVQPTPDQPTQPTQTIPPTSSAQEKAPRLRFPTAKSRLVPGRTISVRWAANPSATYYNVQIFRGATKVASAFPTRGRLVVTGRLLRRGTYRIVIWSGLGAKRNARYARRPWVSQVVRVGGASTAA